MPWSDFITSYTVDDKPKIIPSKPKEQSDIDTTPKPEPWSFDRSRMDVLSVKTTAQRQKEDGRLKDEKLRVAVFKSRIKYSDPVMDKWSQPDGLLHALNCVRSEPESSQLEAAFQCVLNKVSVEDLMMQALACINIQLPEVDVALERWEEIQEFAKSVDENWEKIKGAAEDVDAALERLKEQKFKLPKIPTMDFPDELPVEDIMGDLVEAIGKALLGVLIQAFVSMITNLLEGLIIECQAAEGMDSFGTQDINDGLDNATDPNNGNAVTPESMDNRLADLLDALGVYPFGNTKPLTDGLPDLSPEEISPSLNEQVDVVRNMLSDLSSILTPYELCLLLQGGASNELITLVIDFLNFRYPPADKSKQWTRMRVKKMFAALGGMIDPEYCEQITNPIGSIRYTKSICDEEGAAQLVRRRLYERKNKNRGGVESNKGDDSPDDRMTDKQIDEALKKIRDRKKEKPPLLKEPCWIQTKILEFQRVDRTHSASPTAEGNGQSPNALAGLIQEDHSSY